ncbi:phosphatase PAP2 family protein [Croceimicrobium sp.]|uniref:phosphatase PAP2 family protein n=1 Tax=Croceimicrobium sp. TaxID=2828340 RepID=UPI003BAA7D59
MHAQFSIVQDSWQNAKQWTNSESYSRADAWYWAAGGIAIGAVILAEEPIQNALQWTDPETANALSPFMKPFGDPLIMGSVSALGYLGGWAFKNREIQDLSSAALQSMLSAGIVVMALKLSFHRERPEEQWLTDPYVFRGPSFNSNFLSFPSGHSATAFAFASSISAFYDDPLYLAIPLYSLAGLTAWQRVFTQKHWPSDVVAGALIGTFIGRKIGEWQRERSSKLSLEPSILFGGYSGLSLKWQLDPISVRSERPF